MDRRLAKHDDDIAELKNKVDFFVQTQTPPLQGVFYNGQLRDARVFEERLIGSAKRSLIFIGKSAASPKLGLWLEIGWGVCYHTSVFQAGGMCSWQESEVKR